VLHITARPKDHSKYADLNLFVSCLCVCCDDDTAGLCATAIPRCAVLDAADDRDNAADQR
jgi:hypothetical protein